MAVRRDRRRLEAQLERLRTENRRLRAANKRLRESIDDLIAPEPLLTEEELRHMERWISPRATTER